MEQNIGRNDISNLPNKDLLKGSKSLKEYAGKTFSGGIIMPGDPLCELLSAELIASMETEGGIKYDLSGNIYARQPLTEPDS